MTHRNDAGAKVLIGGDDSDDARVVGDDLDVIPGLQPEFFQVFWMTIRDGKWMSQYDPGWPALLALANLIHLPAWLVNPLLSALSVLVDKSVPLVSWLAATERLARL